jgi:LemA protein
MSTFSPILIIALVIAFVGSIWAILTHNSIVKAGLRVDEAWSTVSVHLKRYASLVPNLVETVSTYAAHERETFEEVTRARNSLAAAGDASAAQAANASLVSALGRLFAVAENYPDLRASDNFASLQRELSDLEERIALARQFYNRTVLDHNTLTATLPSSVIANIMGRGPRAFFETEVEEPKVRFANSHGSGNGRTSAPS